MSRWRPIATTVVSVLGLGIATYLTYVHYSSPKGGFSAVCPGGSSHGAIDCAKVTNSAESIIFGVPVALYGALFFVFMVAICLPRMWRSRSVWVARLRLAAAVAGMGMVLYLISMEAFVIHAICIWCSGVHILQFALFMLIVTGWQDTGWSAALDEAYADEGDDHEYEEELDDEPEPELALPTPGHRLPRGKARRRAEAVYRS